MNTPACPRLPYGTADRDAARRSTRCWSRSWRARWPASRRRSRPRSARTARSPDDPRRARLPGRHPRPAAAQAHRPVVLRAGAPGGARLPARRRCAPGDVFFHNDVYPPRAASATCPTCASPCRCSTTGEVVAFVQAFGHHDDIGGAVPGLDAVARDQRVRGGPDGARRSGCGTPGVPNEAALRIMTRNSRMPESLAADLDAECSACLMGARRLGELFDRYGRDDGRGRASTRSSTRPPRPTGARSSSKIPDGTYVWEDYAEHDGVDEPRLHTQRITLTKRRPAADDPDGERLVLDFTGTSPQAKGPINHCGDYADGVFLKKWLAPILRNLADTPERMAELDVNEGVVPLIEMRFPPTGHAAHPGLPGADQRPHVRHPAAARRAGRRAGQGGRRPDAGRPGDDPLHRRLRRRPRRPRLPDARGARRRLRRPLLRRRRGHHPRRARLAEPADRVHRGALPVPSSSGSGWPSTPAAPGGYRGGLGYEKHIRMLRDAHFMSIADRSILACWGVKGGRAGRPFQVTIDPGGPNEREVDALADAEPVRGRRGDPDPHHRRRRLGRPARAALRRGRARRALGQGVARGRPARLRRGRDRRRRTSRSSTPRQPTRCERSCGRRARASSRSSTAARATPGCPAGPTAAEVDFV